MKPDWWPQGGEIDQSFTIEKRKVNVAGLSQFAIKCRKCGTGWSHPDKEMSAGTKLHLLTHARSH